VLILVGVVRYVEQVVSLNMRRGKWAVEMEEEMVCLSREWLLW
jgi:hypothetical protein